jgi:hypothetical protein
MALQTHIQRGADLLELGGHWGRMDSYRMLAYLKQAKENSRPPLNC